MATPHRNRRHCAVSGRLANRESTTGRTPGTIRCSYCNRRISWWSTAAARGKTSTSIGSGRPVRRLLKYSFQAEETAAPSLRWSCRQLNIYLLSKKQKPKSIRNALIYVDFSDAAAHPDCFFAPVTATGRGLNGPLYSYPACQIAINLPPERPISAC